MKHSARLMVPASLSDEAGFGSPGGGRRSVRSRSCRNALMDRAARWIVRTLAAIALILGPGAARLAAQPEVARGVADDQLLRSEDAVAGRAMAVGAPVRINARLQALPQVTLSLPRGLELKARREHLQDLGNGDFVWSGQVEGERWSRVTIAVRRGVAAGSIMIPREAGAIGYELEPRPTGESVLIAADTSSIPPETGTAVPPLLTPSYGDLILATDANPAVVDVMVVYTPRSRDRYGQSGLEAKIQAAIADANQGYRNSQVHIQMNLVHMAVVNYTEVGSLSSSLGWLGGLGDGVMDEVHTWRDTYGADLVSLVSEDSEACGLGYLMTAVTTDFAPYAFTVVYSGCLSSAWLSLAHEMGHNMGCQHDQGNASCPGAFPYSYAYVNCPVGYRTVMAYDCSPGGAMRINYYSTPNVTYYGYPLGVAYAADPANAADNAQSLNWTAHTVEAFRQAPLPPPAAPTGLTAAPVSDTQVVCAWTDNADNESNYLVERSPDGMSWTQTATLPADATAFTDTTVVGNTVYGYRVRAVNGGGASDYSDVAEVTTPPSPPPAAPGNAVASALSPTQINLTWTDNANNETGFKVERSQDGLTWTQIATPGANVTAYADSGLSAATGYSYRVQATNAGGDSAYSNTANATTQPFQPPIVSATFTSLGAEDGYVLESAETSNSGGSFKAGTACIGDDNKNKQYRSIFSFDTSSLPEGAIIESAALRLNVASISGSNPFLTFGPGLVDLKSGTGFGGSTALAKTDFQAPADAMGVARMSAVTTKGLWSSGSLNAAGLALIDTGGRTQFRVYFQLDDDNNKSASYVTFNTGTAGSVSLRPQLVLTYKLLSTAPAGSSGYTSKTRSPK